MQNRSKSSIGWSYTNRLLQHFAILCYWSTITTIFQCSFIEFFAAKLVLVSLLIIKTICFATETQHLCTSKLFFEETRLSLSCFLWTVQQVLGDKLSVSFTVKLSVQSLERNWSHSAFSSFFWEEWYLRNFLLIKLSEGSRYPFQFLHTCQYHKTFWRKCSKVPAFSV